MCKGVFLSRHGENFRRPAVLHGRHVDNEQAQPFAALILSAAEPPIEHIGQVLRREIVAAEVFGSQSAFVIHSADIPIAISREIV